MKARIKPEDVVFERQTLIADRFLVTKQLVMYPRIFFGVDKQNRNKEVVIKTTVNEEKRHGLKREEEIYKKIEKRDTLNHFIQRLAYIECRDCKAMVFEKCGANVYQLFQANGRKFSLKTVLILADMMLAKVMRLHMMDIVHRDVKPENFVMGTGNNRNTLYLIDFDQGAIYRDASGVLPNRRQRPIGNPCYLSLNAHENNLQTRRDDLESVAYSLIYLLKGTLPWKGLARHQSRSEMVEKIGKMKEQLDIDTEICNDIPKEFADFLRYCRGMKFDEAPDYVRWRTVFNDLLRSISDDDEFDWVEYEKDYVTVDLAKEVELMEKKKHKSIEWIRNEESRENLLKI